MSLPTFLGIGVPRAGTTWLHTLLASHPDVCLPVQRKEVRFFDRHYERGLAWYETFFCSQSDGRTYRTIGEISPQYLYCDECPSRIQAALPDVKLLVMLRHPVDRAYSQFGMVVQRMGYGGCFEEFLETRPRALEYGFYSRHLSNYLRIFDRSRILPLLFEKAITDGLSARQALASFLGLPVDGFPSSISRVNPSTIPRFRSLSTIAVKTGRKLRRNHLEKFVDLGGRFGVRRLMTSGGRLKPLDPELRSKLTHGFEREFDDLESCLGIDLSSWRKQDGPA
jgi:hypothetical protein